MHGEQQPFDIDAEDLVEVLLGNRPEGRELRAAGVGEENVDAALLPLHFGVKTIEIPEACYVASNARGLLSYLIHGRVELGLPAARDEDVGALLGKASGRGETDPAVASGDDSDLSFQPFHGIAPLYRCCGTR